MIFVPQHRTSYSCCIPLVSSNMSPKSEFRSSCFVEEVEYIRYTQNNPPSNMYTPKRRVLLRPPAI